MRTFFDGVLSPAAVSMRSTTADATPLSWWEEPNPLAGWSAVEVSVPSLHKRVYRDVPAVTRRGPPEEAVFRFNWLSTTGTGLMVAAILSALWMRVRPALFAKVFLATLVRMRWPLLIATMLAIAFTTRFSGTDVTLGLAFTKTGVLYPFFAAMLGWLGVALTGSDTSSNALFGSLQKITAEQLGLSPVLISAANSTGGVMGKMIDAQSIVVRRRHQSAGWRRAILRYVFWHALYWPPSSGCSRRASVWPQWRCRALMTMSARAASICSQRGLTPRFFTAPQRAGGPRRYALACIRIGRFYPRPSRRTRWLRVPAHLGDLVGRQQPGSRGAPQSSPMRPIRAFMAGSPRYRSTMRIISTARAWSFAAAVRSRRLKASIIRLNNGAAKL